MSTHLNPSQYLDYCLSSYGMRHIADQVSYYKQKRDLVQKSLEMHYKGKLAGNVIYSGSVAKSTEINIKYDVDLIVPFRYDAFPNLEEMTKDLFKFFLQAYKDHDKQPPRDQRVSVGLTFTHSGKTISMDIVPGREIKRDGYEPERYLNLYDTDAKRCFQTNIKRQVEAIKQSNDNARNIIRLLKVWKHKNSKKILKGFILELLVLRAFRDAGEHPKKGLWPQLKMTLEYIRDHIESARLVDPGNSNNIVSDLMTINQKIEIANAMRNMLNSISADESRLRNFFPLNPKFQ